MPQSLRVSTPPSSSIKRQRSQDNVTDASLLEQRSSNGKTVERDEPASRVTVKIPSYLNKTRSEISAAFMEIEWKQRSRLAHALQNPNSSPFRVARTPVVINRNRYGNVQPWDLSRVRLKKPIGGSDYVNASPIILNSREAHPTSRNPTPAPSMPDRPPQRIQTRYIATQGPKEGQYSHFWHMVMQETPGDVGVIVMLTQLYEGNKEKCAQYYPSDLGNPTIVLPAHEDSIDDDDAEDEDDGDPFLDIPALTIDADYREADSDSQPISSGVPPSNEEAPAAGTVTLLSLSYDEQIRCEVRRLKLSIDGESKEIYHYLFNGWPDFGKPEAEDRLALIALARVSKGVAKDAPRIVHCSAGVGRTGTWIALDYLLQELEAGRLTEAGRPTEPSSSSQRSKESKQGKQPRRTSPAAQNGTWGRSGPPKPGTPDPKEDEDVIAETVNLLREQRMMMVMNELQLLFLYEVMKEAFIEKYSEKETGPIVIEIQEPSPKVARKQSPFRGIFDGFSSGRVRSEEDTVSEAETEIMERERAAAADGDDDDDDDDGAGNIAMSGEQDDPYSAVAPDTIREGIKKTQQSHLQQREDK